MARGAKPAQAKTEAKSPVGSKGRKRDGSSAGEVEQRLAEALAQQAAISEILRVISASPGDVKPVLNAVAERASKLCDADNATIFLLEGDKLRAAARFGVAPRAIAEGQFMPLIRGSVTGRAVIDRAVIHMEDMATASEEEFPLGRELQRRGGGYHSVVSVPLMHNDRAIGAITLWRMEVRRFTDKQIALVKTFADQAVIAIENVRLFKETKEALEQQTATSEILRVISQSPTNVQPVFDSIANAALKLCSASSANVFTYDGQLLRVAALAIVNPEGADAIRRAFPRPPGRDTAAGRAVLSRSVVVIPDVLEDPDFSHKAIALASDFRSMLDVPLMRDGTPIGAIAVGRPEPGPFPDKQIALLQTFADQAVIAIENVRLFTELEARKSEI
jgi:GAF domain-containing protein